MNALIVRIMLFDLDWVLYIHYEGAWVVSNYLVLLEVDCADEVHQGGV